MFTASDLLPFNLSPEDVFEQGDLVWVKKWNWDYEKAHSFQRFCLKKLDSSPRKKVLIVCNHPRVFTNGRGLQKPRKGQVLDLVEFNPALSRELPYPLFQIERGGGLTFHHPGQFIFYPILKLSPLKLSLGQMIDEIFSVTKTILIDWGVTDLSTENVLMGIWKGNQKLASMGIAIEKLTTFHGMALNIFEDRPMMDALKKLNPCGLSATTYTSVDQVLPDKTLSLEAFTDAFIQRINHAWK